MTIYPDTKIASVIKHHKGSIEAIASLAKPFTKLRNPVLRKVLAARTTLADAARIGGCDIEALGAVLKPLGFELIAEPEKHHTGAGALAASVSRPERAHLIEQVLDVREDLASGKDPLKKMMAAASALAAGSVLKVINTFEPTPLIAVLARKGFESDVERIAPEEVHTFFWRPAEADTVSPAEPDPGYLLTQSTVFDEKIRAFAGRIRETDVRELEMPQPMVTILEALEELPADHALLVTHRRIPVFLFSELAARGFQYDMCQAGESLVHILIFSVHTT